MARTAPLITWIISSNLDPSAAACQLCLKLNDEISVFKDYQKPRWMNLMVWMRWDCFASELNHIFRCKFVILFEVLFLVKSAVVARYAF